MLNKRGGFYAIVLGFIVLATVASMVGSRAGQGANAGLRIAAVDRTRLITDYKYTKDTDLALQKQQADAELRLRTWAQNALLTEGDQSRLSDLLLEEQTAGANFDAGKKAEMKKLQQKSADEGNEFTNLQGNQNPNPAQQMRLGVLTRAFSETQTRVESARKTITVDLQKKDQESQAKIIRDMREAIAQVAKAKGFSLVLPTDIAYFSDNDITDAVLATMNKK